MKNFTKIMMLLCAVITMHVATAQTPGLSSFGNAQATIFFDFDGHTVQSAGWRGGMAFNCAPSGLTETQITEIFKRVSEDYRPFDVNITTDSSEFLSAPVDKRMRIVVTTTSAWYTGVGGVAYIGSFTWGDDTPGFVFPDRLSFNAKFVAECCTHESGHTVGLSHQSAYDANCVLTQTYATGAGSGETGWAPVMGNSYNKNMTGWNDGPTPYGCTSTQDNLTTIISVNGFGFRADDYNENFDSNTFSLGNSNFNAEGIISTTTDNDVFEYNMTQHAAFHFEARPFGLDENNSGANLDIMVKLFDANLVLIRIYNPLDKMNVVFDTTLSAGKYYILISGTGNSNVNEYGSLGSYSLLGVKGALPIHDVSISGKTENNRHVFNWNIVSDEPVKTQTIEVSTDGRNFSSLSTVSAASRNFSYSPSETGILYYRLKVVSVIDQTVYSNVLALKVTGKTPVFNISTLVQNDISVNGSSAYQYILMDMNGRTVAKGNGTKGFNNISLQNKASGMYVLQIIGDHIKQTERIIKQ
ncbi:MAG: T9SS type A sorting domain-containing protein [Ferruginibacter sp.]